MPTLKCASIAGIKMWFWSNDHQPPHFHVKRSGEWEYKIYFLLNASDMFECEWSKTKKATMSRQDKQQIIAMVETHRATIFQEWEQAHP